MIGNSTTHGRGVGSRWCRAASVGSKWVGCAIAAHEGLAAGLVGAGGALLAAIIAADSVWQQIVDARQQVQIADQCRDRRGSPSITVLSVLA